MNDCTHNQNFASFHVKYDRRSEFPQQYKIIIVQAKRKFFQCLKIKFRKLKLRQLVASLFILLCNMILWLMAEMSYECKDQHGEMEICTHFLHSFPFLLVSSISLILDDSRARFRQSQSPCNQA